MCKRFSSPYREKICRLLYGASYHRSYASHHSQDPRRTDRYWKLCLRFRLLQLRKASNQCERNNEMLCLRKDRNDGNKHQIQKHHLHRRILLQGQDQEYTGKRAGLLDYGMCQFRGWCFFGRRIESSRMCQIRKRKCWSRSLLQSKLVLRLILLKMEEFKFSMQNFLRKLI